MKSLRIQFCLYQEQEVVENSAWASGWALDYMNLNIMQPHPHELHYNDNKNMLTLI